MLTDNGSWDAKLVSIHARVERATREAKIASKDFDVSIHARVERATLAWICHDAGRIRFNPRTRRACDGRRFSVRQTL